MNLRRTLPAVLFSSALATQAFGQTPAPAAAPPPNTAAPLPAPAVTPGPATPAPAPAAPPPAAACFPSCRTGYLCMQGQCVSACNPPCASGEQCTASGQCERVAVAAPAPVATGPVVASGPPPDAGWARGAGVYGVVAAIGTIALTAASEATKEDQIPALPLGAGATALIAVSGPVTAVGAASARQGGGVKGAQATRIVGWVGYALSLLDASILIGMGVNEVEPADGLILSVGLLGAASLGCFATDAFVSASEADAAAGAPPTPPQGFELSVSPALALRRTPQGTYDPTLGLTGTF